MKFHEWEVRRRGKRECGGRWVKMETWSSRGREGRWSGRGECDGNGMFAEKVVKLEVVDVVRLWV